MIIEVKDLHKNYGRHDALRGLNLSVPEGSAYALIGANGAGKTTAFKILLNLIAAQSGTATVLGVESSRLTPRTLAQIGYVSENQVLPGRLTVAAYLDYIRPLYATWDAALETELLNGFRLSGERRIGDLSHGMRIELALTAALSYRPKLLILDEPFGGVDVVFRDELLDGVLRQAQDTTILISSHELGEIERFVTHVGFLEKGKLRFEQSVDDMNARFRDVRVVLNTEPVLPLVLPPTWLDVSMSGNALSFVDSAYDEAALAAQVSSVFGEIRSIDVQSVGLRKVFTALVRSARKHG